MTQTPPFPVPRWSLHCLFQAVAHPRLSRAGPISGGSSVHVSSYVDTTCNQRCQTTVARVKQGQRCGRRGSLLEGRRDRILPRQESSSNRPSPACPAGAEVLVARRTAFPRHVRPRSARPTGEGVSLATHLVKPPCSSSMDARVPRLGCWTRDRVPLLGTSGAGRPETNRSTTFAQIRAVWERHRFSRWPCHRLGVPASVAPTPAGPVCRFEQAVPIRP